MFKKTGFSGNSLSIFRRAALCLAIAAVVCAVGLRPAAAASISATIASPNPFQWNDYARSSERVDISVTNTGTAAAAVIVGAVIDVNGALGTANADISATTIYAPLPTLVLAAGQTGTIHQWLSGFTGDSSTGPKAGTYNFNVQLINTVDGTSVQVAPSIVRSYPTDQASGGITGRVTDAVTGGSLTGATIYFVDPGSFRAGVPVKATNTGGTYSTAAIQPGTYYMYADAPGYETQFVGGVVVTAAAVTTQNFALTAGSLTAGSTTPAATFASTQPIYDAVGNSSLSRIATAPGVPAPSTGYVQVVDSAGNLSWQQHFGAASTVANYVPAMLDEDALVDISPDSTKVAAGTQDGMITMYDAGQGTAIWQTSGGSDVNPLVNGPYSQSVIHVSDVHFAPGGTQLIAGTTSGMVYAFTVATGQVQWKVPTTSGVRGIRVSPDGSTVYVANSTTIYAFNSTTGAQIWANPALVYRPWDSMAITADGSLLATGGKDGVVRVFNSADGTMLWSHSWGASVEGVAFSPDGQNVVVSVTGGSTGFLYDFGPTGELKWLRADAVQGPGLFIDSKSRFIGECLSAAGGASAPAAQVIDMAGSPIWTYATTAAFSCRKMGLTNDGTALYVAGSAPNSISGTLAPGGLVANFSNWVQVKGSTVQITSLGTTSGAQGSTPSVKITSDNSNFTIFTTASFGPYSGITVKTLTYGGANVVTLGLQIAPNTPLGYYDVTVTTPGADVATALAAFQVVPPNNVSTPTSTLDAGSVFSTAQTDSQSYLRFYNSGTTAGTVSVTLADYNTGTVLTQWTSPSIAPGAAPQYTISTIEGAPGSFTKPSYYSVTIQPNMTGFFQHVLWHVSDGTLTNLSTCSEDVTANPTQLNNVHTSILNNGYPSSVVVNNTGTAAITVALDLLDARNGNKLGTYITNSIPAGGQVILPVSTMEAGAHVTPTPGVMYHYVIQAEAAFTGFLQHLVNNQQAGVITDMTTVCSMSALSRVAPPPALHEGAVFSTAQNASQSYLRFYNSSTAPGTVTVTLSDYTSGNALATWTSPKIPAGAALQFPIATIEAGASQSFTKPAYYSVAVQPGMTGYFQHVLWHVADGTLTNLSTCDYGVTASPTQLNNVHSSLLNYGYPSSVVINNTGTAATTVALDVIDARYGTKLGTYTSASIASGGQVIVPVSTIELGAGVTPGTGMYHYVIQAQSLFTGYLQHLVDNLQAGVITDMSTMCRIPGS